MLLIPILCYTLLIDFYYVAEHLKTRNKTHRKVVNNLNPSVMTHEAKPYFYAALFTCSIEFDSI